MAALQSFHWKTIIPLSLLGIVAGIAVKFGVTDRIFLGFILWVVIPAVDSIVLYRIVEKYAFWQGFITGSLAGVWMAALDSLAIHFQFSNTDSMANSEFIAGLLTAIIIAPGVFTGAYTSIAQKIFTHSKTAKNK